MNTSRASKPGESAARFDRKFFDSPVDFTRIGSGELGGKASGLAEADRLLKTGQLREDYPDIVLNIPRMTVLTTEVFDAFIAQNDLAQMAASGLRDERIAEVFQQATFPAEFVGDLRGLIANVHQPLAVRSSSLMEDALRHPFAGIYETKMIPNNQPDIETRFRQLMEAIKFVYASTWFAEAKAYLQATPHGVGEEKMAVIIQEVVGQRFGDRFYPDISGVARSYTYYPLSPALPEQGVIELALGLGKTIVDGGLCWSYSPALPNAKAPFASASDMMKRTQSRFWAVNMGKPPAYDPIRETEYMLHCSLADAEVDGVLDKLASTYLAESDQLRPGTSSPGPRVLNFAPILNFDAVPLNALVRSLMQTCEEYFGGGIELEFAVTLPRNEAELPRFGFLQVRAIEVPKEHVHVDWAHIESSRLLLASDRVLGNGDEAGIRDILYVRPDTFNAAHARSIADDIGALNAQFVRDRTPYLLIGFGRWGTSDPWLGIPVSWSQVSGARVIVEATRPEMNVDLSQGSHFFHNLSSLRVSYFAVRHDGEFPVQWEWLERQDTIRQTAHVRHVRLGAPLTIRVDGRCGKGVISHD